ncbi:MAG: DNA repair protein RadA [Candidatus Saccharibacteria bacterium]|nr:DNA repair protein RadA [Candidatus Saccharibacteria bacterium]
MAKAKNLYVCSNCGNQTGTWAGRCQACGEWNTLVEQVVAAAPGTGSSRGGRKIEAQGVAVVAKVDKASRFAVDGADIDTVLGGGIVAGSVILIAGQPGIGKSTLLLQLADLVSRRQSVLYVSGEESAHQVGLRAQRLGVSGASFDVAMSSDADDIAATIAAGQHGLVIVDSIQAIATSLVASAAGSVAQISNCAQLLINAAKKTNTALVIVGHVTKEGSIAGPKVLEHVVDVVLQLEGDRYGGFKLLRAVKNRFGSTNETGIFEMTDKGLGAVKNPSAALLEERQVSDGSIVLATMEGTRPLLVEVQALVNKSNFGYPKRTASGIDLNRVNLLVAVLEKRTKLQLAEADIYINIVGGMKITEPAADLAVCMAIASAAKGMVLKKDLVVYGEIGLSGEVRHVPFAEKRLAEALRMGFEGSIGPGQRGKKQPQGLYSVKDVRSALNQFLS